MFHLAIQLWMPHPCTRYGDIVAELLMEGESEASALLLQEVPPLIWEFDLTFDSINWTLTFSQSLHAYIEEKV